MEEKLRVIFATAEASPYARSGELADVASALPKYLARLGVNVSVVMPHYRTPEIESLSKDLVMSELFVPLGDGQAKARVYKSAQGKYDIYFIDSAKYFWRENIYGTGKGEYLDNDERFVFFCRAILEFLLRSGKSADILHCNSWPTALIPVFLKTHYAHKSRLKDIASLLTLHNISYQGDFPLDTLALTGLNWDYLGPKKLTLNGKFNFLKSGILFADMLNTVSDAYRMEILQDKNGFGLHDILKGRQEELWSIRNGVDYEIWDPGIDPFIVSNYTSSDLGARKDCKADLMAEFGLSLPDATPLLGMGAFMTANKGFELLLDSVEELLKREVGLVVLGHGDESYEKRFKDIQKEYPGRFSVRVDSSPILFHKVIAGSDILLVPSRREPCGLNQFYGFRYGAVPVVHSTGGMKETVRPFNRDTLEGNGFVFDEYSPRAFLDAVGRACDLYNTPQLWSRIMKAGFKEDFSWENSAKKYTELYLRTIEKRKGG
jgi:starch synthase